MIKKIYIAITILSTLFSCTKTILLDIQPRIELNISENLIYSDTCISAGKPYSIGIIASSAGGENLTNLIVKSNGKRIFDKGYNHPEIEENILLTKTLEDTEKIEIILLNKARIADTLSLLIEKLNTSYLPIKRYSNVIIGAQSNSIYGNYFSFSNAQIYSQAQAFNNQETIDLVYYFDAVSDANTLASPGANLSGIITGVDAPEFWTIKNTTYYSRTAINISDEEFNNSVNDSLILSNLFIDGGRKAKQLQNSQYYGIQTHNKKNGIIKIETVTGQADGTIQFSAILQQ
jgi:hypothetical protein